MGVICGGGLSSGRHVLTFGGHVSVEIGSCATCVVGGTFGWSSVVVENCVDGPGRLSGRVRLHVTDVTRGRIEVTRLNFPLGRGG